MVLTQVSFDDIYKFWHQSTITGIPRMGSYGTVMIRGQHMTFEDVAKIESLRRKIEALQEVLNDRLKITILGYQVGPSLTPPSVAKWTPVEGNKFPIFRETLCKSTIVDILKLLDESERLGVDVTKPKEALLGILEALKPGSADDDVPL
jgi:hypothetical protein